MFKKVFFINCVNIDLLKFVWVVLNLLIVLLECELCNIWVMIGVFVLIVVLIGIIVMLYVLGVCSLVMGFFLLMGIGVFSMLVFFG